VGERAVFLFRKGERVSERKRRKCKSLLSVISPGKQIYKFGVEQFSHLRWITERRGFVRGTRVGVCRVVVSGVGVEGGSVFFLGCLSIQWPMCTGGEGRVRHRKEDNRNGLGTGGGGVKAAAGKRGGGDLYVRGHQDARRR